MRICSQALAAMLNQDPDFQIKLEACQKQVNEGEDLSHALFSSGILTGTYARLASIGQKTGSMDQVMKQVSDMYQEEIKTDTSVKEVLEHIVPNCVTGFIYGALVESFASEHSSRMMAMQAATDSAKDMLQQLSIEYNRVRQSAITQQITEIIGGAKAQKKK